MQGLLLLLVLPVQFLVASVCALGALVCLTGCVCHFMRLIQ
jgi:hypothetical protein